MARDKKKAKSVAVIVAHPDDEILWVGGTILSQPFWKCFIVCLCRRSDTDRAPKFFKALKILGADGAMGDLDDGPEQKPLDENELNNAILNLLPSKHFDLIITHDPRGEYTRHVRHEETSKAVIKLWHDGSLSSNELWTFAYEDGNKQYYPKPIESASKCNILTDQIWMKKYNLITETYGFDKTSFEAETTPRSESFWQFTNSDDAKNWLEQFENT